MSEYPKLFAIREYNVRIIGYRFLIFSSARCKGVESKKVYKAERSALNAGKNFVNKIQEANK